ncbi:MAG: hypothetical protein EBQ76_07875 [Betaproteobacteria bacterium]|nr:hypothetical protein [Betaproteobacteria bacterium]
MRSVSFTQRLLRSLALFLLMAVALLALVIGLQRDRLSDLSSNGTNEFIPQKVVSLRIIVLESLLEFRSTQQSDSQALSAGAVQACQGRPLLVVASRLGLSEDQTRAIFALVKSRSRADLSCRTFLDALNWLAQQPELFEESNAKRRRSLIEASSTERVSWLSLPPCLTAETKTGKWVTLAGARGRCESEGSAQELSSQTIAVGRWIYRRAVLGESVDGRLQSARTLELSLSGPVQDRLETLKQCLSGMTGKGCRTQELALAKHLDAYVVVLINQTTGGISGMLCEGKICAQSGLQGSEPLAALLAQSPPASTAKLFVSLALAETLRDSKESKLALQIKTSGQIDDASQKRNEWWERSVLCDVRPDTRGSRGSPSVRRSIEEEIHKCDVASRAQALAVRMGFNRFCESSSSSPGSCGRLNLGTQSVSVPGFLGRFDPQGSANDLRVMGWASYEAVRSGRDKPPKAPLDVVYLRTSRAVQSVIGAGDARISALGLAHVSGQLVGSALGLSPPAPWLLRAKDQPSRDSAQTISIGLSPADQQRSRAVLEGMAKVLRPAEAGWQGAGTAYPAVVANWGDQCKSGCPLWGKTGTVGHADKVHGGTTVFSGAFNGLELSSALSRQSAVFAKQSSAGLWSLGVIAVPKRRTGIAGHQASHLAISVLDRLLESDGGPPQP